MDTTEFPARRQEMIQSQIVGRGVRCTRVLDALRSNPRECFLPEHLRGFAYEDSRLPLSDDRTLPRPWVFAAMAAALALKGDERCWRWVPAPAMSCLDEVDEATAKVARQRYGCLTPWQADPGAYGHAGLTERCRGCERKVVSTLTDLFGKRTARAARNDGERCLDALQNARLIAHAERYDRTMYCGSRAAWNLRDSHMFETLKNLLEFHGAGSKGIVWAHNAHIGHSAGTGMSLRGEFNLDRLCRRTFGQAVHAIGFGTNSGTMAAASDWDAPMESKTVRPGMPGSCEKLFHEAGIARFLLPLSRASSVALTRGLSIPRLQRALGVVFRPEMERQSHDFDAVLTRQFDGYIWFDQTQSVTPLATEKIDGLPETDPFGL